MRRCYTNVTANFWVKKYNSAEKKKYHAYIQRLYYTQKLRIISVHTCCMPQCKCSQPLRIFYYQFRSALLKCFKYFNTSLFIVLFIYFSFKYLIQYFGFFFFAVGFINIQLHMLILLLVLFCATFVFLLSWEHLFRVVPSFHRCSRIYLSFLAVVISFNVDCCCFCCTLMISLTRWEYTQCR